MIREFSLFVLLLFPYILKSQGCSDAGICSMPQSVIEDRSDSEVFLLSIQQSWELGEQNSQYLHTTLGFELQAINKLNISVYVPFRNVTYNSQWYSYLSDLTIATQYKTNSNLAFAVAAKLPLGTVSATDKYGNDLPMALQGGLGTYDLLLQAQYYKTKWNVAFAYQHPFSGIENTFEPNGEFIDFQNSYHLDRGDDIMLRYNRLWNGKSLSWMASLVSVYRIKGDYIYENQKVNDSEGISVNLGLQAIKPIKKGNLKAQLAVPVYVRKARPDGLTRTVILALSWSGFL